LASGSFVRATCSQGQSEFIAQIPKAFGIAPPVTALTKSQTMQNVSAKFLTIYNSMDR
jgi:hypothetical protein